MSAEPGYWMGVRREQLSRNLADALALARRYHQQPAWLRKHFSSFMALFQSARYRPDLHPVCVELVLALHPWPVRWGLWTAWQQALQFAAAAASQPEVQAELLGHRAQLVFESGRLDEAVQTAGLAIEQARRARHAPAVGIAGAALIVSLIARGEVESAQRWMQQLEEDLSAWAENAPAGALQLAQAHLALHKTTLLRRAGRLSEAIVVADQSIVALAAVASAAHPLRPLAYQMRATLHWAQGSYLQAVADLEHAIALFSAQEDPVAEVGARGNLGLVYWSMADLDQAEASMLACLAQSERIDARSELVRQVGNLVAICLSRGQLQRGMQYVERQLELANLAGDEEEASRARGNRGGLLLYLGDYPAAEIDLRESLALFEAQGRPEAVQGTFVDLALLYAHWGKAEIGLPYAQQALSAARRLNIPVLEIIALRALAECHPLAQRRPFLQQALDLAAAHHRRLDQAGCWLSLAGVAESRAEQADAWQKGTLLLEEMGAAAWLDGHSPEDPPCVALLM